MKTERLSTGRQRAKYIVSDILTGALAFFVFNIARYYLLNEYSRGFIDLWAYLSSAKLVIEQCIVPVALTVVYWLSGYYNMPFGKSRLQELITTFFSVWVNTAILYLVLLINDQTGRRTINYELILTLFGVMFIFTYIVRLIVTENARRHFRAHQWEFRALIIGNSPVARSTARRLEKGPSRVGYKILGFVSIPGENSADGEGRVFNFDNLESVCRSEGVDQLIIAPEKYDESKVLDIVFRLFPIGIPIKISPDTLSFLTSGIRLKDIYAEPFIDLTAPALTEASKNIKRVADVVISLIVLLLLSPFYALIAACVKATSKGPVFYSQERVGWRQKPFMIYKFRTMRVDAEASGPQLSSDNDPRITEIGKMLRKYRIDELPQFWNVLKGDMSIVGPRPEREFFIRQIMKEAPYYTLIYQVRPGITSWGMVKYGYASNVSQMVERTRYDLIYLSNMSLYVDMKILIYTVKTVVTGRGM